MKSVLFVLALVSASNVFASESYLVCEKVPAAGIVKIEIVKDGEMLRLVETMKDEASEKLVARVSKAFSIAAFEKNAIPALSENNGYRRQLIREGKGRYSIASSDECSTSYTTLSCKEQL